MRYILLIYHNEKAPPGPTEESKRHQEYMVFTQDIVKTGIFNAGNRLESTVVRRRYRSATRRP
jgi:hypothetical protein